MLWILLKNVLLIKIYLLNSYRSNLIDSSFGLEIPSHSEKWLSFVRHFAASFNYDKFNHKRRYPLATPDIKVNDTDIGIDIGCLNSTKLDIYGFEASVELELVRGIQRRTGNKYKLIGSEALSMGNLFWKICHRSMQIWLISIVWFESCNTLRAESSIGRPWMRRANGQCCPFCGYTNPGIDAHQEAIST